MWNTKPKFNEQEQEIINLIELLANHKGTKVEVELEDLTFYLDNKELHYSAIIDGKGIKITNSSFSVHKHFRDKVLAVSKSFARKRITEEVQKTKDSIDAREKEMFNKMQESLTKNKIMKKLLLLLSLTLLTLSCSTDETTQRDENCYNSEVAYPQISLLPTWQGEFYRHINGVEILPRLVNTSNSITVYLENGEVRTYCKAVQMAQPYLDGANEPDSNNLRLTTTDYFRINRTSTNGYDISISSTEGDLINYAFAKR